MDPTTRPEQSRPYRWTAAWLAGAVASALACLVLLLFLATLSAATADPLKFGTEKWRGTAFFGLLTADCAILYLVSRQVQDRLSRRS